MPTTARSPQLPLITHDRSSDKDPKNTPNVCDHCLTAAYDMNARTLQEQQMVCIEIGNEIADHLCIVTEEPQLNIPCRCACKPARKQAQQ